MASVNIFGGGFFFAPFTQTAVYRVTVACVVPGVYGAWSSYITNITFKARWMSLMLTLGAPGQQWEIQLGLGPIGAEVVWQPSLATGLGGVIDGFLFPVNADNTSSHCISFPITLDAGLQLSARGREVNVGFCNVQMIMWG